MRLEFGKLLNSMIGIEVQPIWSMCNMLAVQCRNYFIVLYFFYVYNANERYPTP